MEIVSEDRLARSARVLENLAARHGLSNLRRAGDGHLIADIGTGRTYMDVARFELDVLGVLGASVDVVLAGTQGAALLDRGALVAGRAA